MHGAPVDCAMSSAAASHETIPETRLEGADTAVVCGPFSVKSQIERTAAAWTIDSDASGT